MALYDRLIGLNGSKIPVHAFMAAVAEIERGKLTVGQVATAFELDAGEQTELTTLVGIIRTPQEGYTFCGRVPLTNVGATFDANIDSQSLPFIYIQRAGVNRVDIELRVRKVGTGTQHWQLWDDTTAGGTAVIDTDTPTANTTGSLSDAAAAGDHMLNASRTFPTPLSAGVVKLRLRCRSTVAADDPVFLQGALLLFRTDKRTSIEFHELLLLAEPQLFYTTVAAFKSRFGIP